MKAKTTGFILIRNLRVLFFLFTSLFVLSTYSQQQTKNFESLMVSDGLAQSLVVDIIRDQYGYVWFGTFGGLSRYDGKEFVNFYPELDDSTSISSETIWRLYEANNGDIWIGTYGGLNKYDRSTEQFVRYHHPDLDDKVVKEIGQWSADTLIIGTTIGLYFFDMMNESFFRMPEFERFDKTQQFHITASGNLFLINDKILYLINKKGEEISQMKVGRTKGIYVDQNDNIWLVTYEDIRFISSDQSVVKSINTESSASYLSKIVEDEEGHVIVANGELYVFDLNGTLLETHVHDPNRDFSLTGNSAISIEVDKDGIWWVGTNGYGVNKYDPHRFFLGFLGHQSQGTPSIRSNYVTSFFTADDEHVYVGTAASLDLFDRKTSTVKNIYPGRVDFLMQDKALLWAAASDRLLLIDIEKQVIIDELKFEHFGSPIRFMKMDESNNLWLASGNGLHKLNPKNRTDYTWLTPPDHAKKYGPTDWFNAIYEVENGIILGSSSGMFKMDYADEIVLKIEEELLAPLSKSFIKCIEEDNNGIVWIGTASNGLFRWDRANNKLDHYTKKDGLPSNVIYGVLQDDQGFVWMSTNHGLSRLNDQTKEFLNLDIGYGLQSNEFNTTAYFKSKHGTLYFGGVEGLNYFKPNLVENSMEPETYISGFYLRNERMAPADLGMQSKAIMDVDTLVLDYKQNMLSFDFSSTNLTISELNQFAYYLDGLEEDWNFVGNRSFANYSALQPGNYVFKVKSSNNSGMWDQTPAQMVIIITEPYWQTGWFMALLITSTIFLIVLIAGLRIRALKRTEARLNLLVYERTANLQTANEDLKKTMEEKEAAQQKLIQSEKMAALGTLSAGVGHEINNPLNFIKQALIGLEKELGKKEKSDPGLVGKFTTIMYEGVNRATNIVKGLSSFSRDTESFDEETNVESIIDNCIVLLNSKLKGRVNIVKNYMTEQVVIKGNAGKLHQLFFNLISNAEQAIKKSGTVTLTTAIEGSAIHITIADTGHGISNENLGKVFDPFFTTKDPGEGTGLGLAISQTIIKQHKGGLTVTSELNKGTTFKVILPLA